jgi:Na(+)-translocating NADH:ubiquinone oxidoreductase A subunit
LFNEICVQDGQQVNAGDVIAKDPNNFALPLLAPRGGIVQLTKAPNHVVLTDILPPDKKVHIREKHMPHIVQEVGTAGIKRYKLLSLGAWQFFQDAYTGKLPDPLGAPQAVIVSTLSLEPFLARGNVQLYHRLLQFTRGLEHLQSLLEYQPIYLIMPNVKSSFASQVREHIRGYAWVKLIQVPLKYPYDNFNILARALGLKKTASSIWAVRVEGILAIDRALTVSKSCLVRIVSIGGPAVSSPVHLKAMVGYPIQTVLDKYVTEPDVRLLDGGLLTGEPVSQEILGLDTECRGLTVVPQPKEREFLRFIKPGWGHRSYSNCFLSALRTGFSECLTSSMQGETRPCISCNFCEEVCPVGIIPHLLHKYLYRDLIEEVEQARVDLCIECGLCSFVCPSKIELRSEFIGAKKLIEEEKEEVRQEQAKQQLQEKIE